MVFKFDLGEDCLNIL